MTISQFCEFLTVQKLTPSQFATLSAIRQGHDTFKAIREKNPWISSVSYCVQVLRAQELIEQSKCKKTHLPVFKAGIKGHLMMERFEKLGDEETAVACAMAQ